MDLDGTGNQYRTMEQVTLANRSLAYIAPHALCEFALVLVLFFSFSFTESTYCIYLPRSVGPSSLSDIC